MRSTLGLAAAVFSGVLGVADALEGTIRARGVEEPEKPQGRKAKVHLELYYETLCPYCHDLMNGALRQIWSDAEFKDRVSVDLLPFGNAMVLTEDHISAGYHFFHPDAKYPVIICQHYQGECLGNEIQTCSRHLYGVNKTVDLALCMVGRQVKGQGIEMASYDCMTELKIKPQRIKDCVGSDDNIKRMVEIGKRSTRPELNRSYVPWVTADDAHVQLDDDHDLITPLCKMLAPPLPKLCTQKPSKPKQESTALASTGRSKFAMRDSDEAKKTAKKFFSPAPENQRRGALAADARPAAV